MTNISKTIKVNALKAIVNDPVYATRLEKLLSDEAFESLFNGVIDTITIIDPKRLLSNRYSDKEDRVILYDTAEVVEIFHATGDFRVSVKATERRYYRSEEDFDDEYASSSCKSDTYSIEHWRAVTLSSTFNINKAKNSIKVSFI